MVIWDKYWIHSSYPFESNLERGGKKMIWKLIGKLLSLGPLVAMIGVVVLAVEAFQHQSIDPGTIIMFIGIVMSILASIFGLL